MAIEENKLAQVLKKYQSERSNENTVTLMQTVVSSKFLSPYVMDTADPVKQPCPMTVEGKDGENYLAVFSSKKELGKIKGFEKVKTKVLSYSELETILLHEDNVTTNGFIIDPYTHRAKFNTYIIGKLKATRKQI